MTVMDVESDVEVVVVEVVQQPASVIETVDAENIVVSDPGDLAVVIEVEGESSDAIVVLSTEVSVVEVLESSAPDVIAVPAGLGPQGPPGPKGDPGGDGVSFVYYQNSPASFWTIPAFSRRASVSIWIDDELVEADVTQDDTNVYIVFPYPVSGYAILN